MCLTDLCLVAMDLTPAHALLVWDTLLVFLPCTGTLYRERVGILVLHRSLP